MSISECMKTKQKQIAANLVSAIKLNLHSNESSGKNACKFMAFFVAGNRDIRLKEVMEGK